MRAAAAQPYHLCSRVCLIKETATADTAADMCIEDSIVEPQGLVLQTASNSEEDMPMSLNISVWGYDDARLALMSSWTGNGTLQHALLAVEMISICEYHNWTHVRSNI